MNPSSLKAKYISRLQMSDIADTPIEEPLPVAPVKKQRINAKWFPLLGVKAPILLDGTIPGDSGFDPLGFASSEKTLFWMRDAEIKHGRLAMLAAVGWPLSELWHKNIASVFGLPSILAANDRAPSILNGGLQNTWAFGMLMMSIIFAGYLEGKAMNDGNIFWGAEKPAGYIPGDYKFDPLNLINAKGNKNAMLSAEIKNGRLAMIAITAFVFQEFATKLPVVVETPYLF
jgi:Chlorophyll A-B binding protein